MILERKKTASRSGERRRSNLSQMKNKADKRLGAISPVWVVLKLLQLIRLLQSRIHSNAFMWHRVRRSYLSQIHSLQWSQFQFIRAVQNLFQVTEVFFLSIYFLHHNLTSCSIFTSYLCSLVMNTSRMNIQLIENSFVRNALNFGNKKNYFFWLCLSQFYQPCYILR